MANALSSSGLEVTELFIKYHTPVHWEFLIHVMRKKILKMST